MNYCSCASIPIFYIYIDIDTLWLSVFGQFCPSTEKKILPLISKNRFLPSLIIRSETKKFGVKRSHFLCVKCLTHFFFKKYIWQTISHAQTKKLNRWKGELNFGFGKKEKNQLTTFDLRKRLQPCTIFKREEKNFGPIEP